MNETIEATDREPVEDEAPRSLPGRLTADWQRLERQLSHNPLGRVVTGVGPRTVGYALRTLRRQIFGDVPEGFPRTALTPAHLAAVAVDEAMLLVAKGPDRFPEEQDYVRVGGELADATELYAERGWTANPRSYHRDPPPLGLDEVQVSQGWAHGQRYERIFFPSEFEPYEGEPGRERWLNYATNRTASAWVLRHDDDRPRSWLVCEHGFAMGYAFMEFPSFHVAHLHHDLGLNLIGPTLPVHGHRKISAMSGDAFLSFDLMNSVFGLAQSVWDLRRALCWVRAQEPTAVGVYGFSLGGYVAALTAAVEPDLDAVVAGVPVTDFPTLFANQSPLLIRNTAVEHGIIGGAADLVHRVVSPLVLEPAVPWEARFIYAGLGDRMAHPRQAYNLWKHWGEPRIVWYPGNHTGFLWSRRVRAFLDEVFTERGLVADTQA